MSYRLSKLIKRGNEYECLVHSIGEASCSVHLRETKADPKNKNLQSFPTNKSNNQSASIVDEEFLIEDDIPVEMGNGDSDMSDNFKDTLEKINKGEEY